MHGENMKLTDARQAKVCNIYKNTKMKLLKNSKGSETCRSF